MLSKGLEPVFHGARGKGNQRRAANYSATPAITIYSPRHVNSFLGPGYSSAIAGHAANRNTFLERLFIAPDFSDDAEFGVLENAGLFQSASIQISSLPRVRGARRRALLFQPRWPGRTGFINEDINVSGADLSGGDVKNRREDIALPCKKKINRQPAPF